MASRQFNKKIKKEVDLLMSYNRENINFDSSALNKSKNKNTCVAPINKEPQNDNIPEQVDIFECISNLSKENLIRNDYDGKTHSKNFTCDLRNWMIQYKISNIACNSLLQILKLHFPKAEVPIDCRTLKKTPTLQLLHKWDVVDIYILVSKVQLQNTSTKKMCMKLI